MLVAALRNEGNGMNTYPEMNEKIAGLLELRGDPISLYATARIEELETLLAKVVARDAGEILARNATMSDTGQFDNSAK